MHYKHKDGNSILDRVSVQVKTIGSIILHLFHANRLPRKIPLGYVKQ